MNFEIVFEGFIYWLIFILSPECNQIKTVSVVLCAWNAISLNNLSNIVLLSSLIVVVLQDARNKIVRPWDQFRGSVHAVRPFLPPALLHYEHRLALDYHRHLEHLNAQAQLLRHMNINMTMDLKSESGSERSSSAASDCCSPEIGSGSRLSDHHMHHSGSQQSQQSSQSHHSQKLTKPSDTPLDALFQMTNKNFDESQGNFKSFFLFLFLSFLFMFHWTNKQKTVILKWNWYFERKFSVISSFVVLHVTFWRARFLFSWFWIPN